MKFNAPYLILIGGEKDATYAKTGYGLVHWRRELVAGQLRFSDCELDLGVPDLSVTEAANQGVGSLVIGTATIGGIMPDDWWTVIIEAVDHGLDIINGLHTKIQDNPKIIERAKSSGSRLLDVRVPPSNIPVGSGKERFFNKRFFLDPPSLQPANPRNFAKQTSFFKKRFFLENVFFSFPH